LAVRVAENLRDNGIDVLFHCGGGNFKTQMKKADASGAPLAVIIGDDEAALGEASLKPLRSEPAAANDAGDRQSSQRRVAVDRLAEAITDYLFKQDDE
jgi:histidyl-tRNA synthetase